MKTTELSHQESLEIISEMIGRAKQSFAKGGSFYFLLWGLTMATANFGHYVLETIVEYEMPYIVWLITIPTMLASIIYGIKHSKKKAAVGYFDRIYGQVWMAIGISITVCLVFMYKLDFYHNAVILLMAGIGTYSSGILLRFKPLVIGGLLLFVGGAIAFNVTPADQQLVAGISLVFGYLIPGFLLKRAENG